MGMEGARRTRWRSAEQQARVEAELRVRSGWEAEFTVGGCAGFVCSIGRRTERLGERLEDGAVFVRARSMPRRVGAGFAGGGERGGSCELAAADFDLLGSRS